MQVFDADESRYSAKTSRFTPRLVDLLCVCGLVACTLIALLWNYQGLSLQYWDESRNANNALEMALGSSWLAPTYAGLTDHWNTKPPLLIWLMASLMKLGVSPLLAVRLPSAMAAVVTVLLIWAFVRFGLRDRLAAFIAAAFLLSSKGYMGIHGAHTGDYDTLLALFTAGYVLSVWQALASQGQLKCLWMLNAGSCLLLAVMTKGPAGLFGVVGIFIFLVITGQLLKVIIDWRWWLTLLVVCSITAGYYLLREGYDPGYLQAVWTNELGGRYSETTESHYKGSWFYVRELFKQVIPGCLFLFLLGVTLMGSNVARKRLAQITFFSAAGIIILLSTAKTQLHWYLIPAIPLLCIAAAIALVDTIKRVQIPVIYVRAFLVLFIALPVMISVYRNAISLPAKAQQKNNISQYGVLFERLTRIGQMPTQLTVLDDGIDNTAGFINYNPELRFYAQLEQLKGITIEVVSLANVDAVVGLIATCDYKNTAAVRELLATRLVDNQVCVAGYKGRP